MNEKDFLDLIIKIVGTSIPGYLSYYILTRSNIIDISKNRSEENKIFLAILSGVNVFIGLLALDKFNSDNIIWVTITIIIVMIAVSVFVIPFVTPYISKKTTSFINFLRKRNSNGEIQQSSRYKLAFDHSKPTRVAIFDFSRNYIASGVLAKAPLNNEFDYFDIIMTHHIDEYENPKQSNFIKKYQELERKGSGKYTLYVDFEKKVNIHIFVEN